MSNFLNFSGNSGVTFKNHGTGGGTSFTLDKAATTNSVLLSIGGIIQKPVTDYSVSGPGITTTSSVTSGGEVFSFIIHDAGNAPVIEDNSVTGAKIALGSDAQGDVMYYNGSDWARLAAGTSGHFLKTQGTGANPAWAGAGKVLQFVSAENTANDISRTYHASTLEDTGIAVSITPTATNNKIIIDCMVSDGTSANSQNGAQFGLYRDTTNLHSSTVWGEVTHDHDGSLETISMRYIDTAPGTSAYSYKLYWWQVFGANTSYLNRKGTATTPIHPAIITATEIEV